MGGGSVRGACRSFAQTLLSRWGLRHAGNLGHTGNLRATRSTGSTRGARDFRCTRGFRRTGSPRGSESLRRTGSARRFGRTGRPGHAGNRRPCGKLGPALRANGRRRIVFRPAVGASLLGLNGRWSETHFLLLFFLLLRFARSQRSRSSLQPIARTAPTAATPFAAAFLRQLHLLQQRFYDSGAISS